MQRGNPKENISSTVREIKIHGATKKDNPRLKNPKQTKLQSKFKLEVKPAPTGLLKPLPEPIEFMLGGGGTEGAAYTAIGQKIGSQRRKTNTNKRKAKKVIKKEEIKAEPPNDEVWPCPFARNTSLTSDSASEDYSSSTSTIMHQLHFAPPFPGINIKMEDSLLLNFKEEEQDRLSSPILDENDLNLFTADLYPIFAKESIDLCDWIQEEADEKRVSQAKPCRYPLTMRRKRRHVDEETEPQLNISLKK